MGRDTAQLCDRLRKHLVNGSALKEVVRLSDGHSNETYLLDGLNLILRMPSTGVPLLDAHGMLDQFQVLAVLAGVPDAPPVPQPIYYCDDHSVLGDTFFLMRKAQGVPYPDYEVPDWLSEPPDSFRDELMCNYVDTFARIHRMEPLDVFGSIVSPENELERWRRFALKAGNEPLIRDIDRLAQVPPPSSGKPAIVHGDPKAANILWSGNKPEAVLDWEMGYNGEPLADLGYIIFFFPSEHHGPQPSFDLKGIWDREKIIARWESSTGRSACGVEWFEALASAKITSILSYGHHLAVSGRSDDQRMAAWSPHVEITTETTRKLVEAVA